MSLRELLRPKNAADFTSDLIEAGEIKTAVDIGCGSHSYLSRFRPRIRTVGIDSCESAIEISRAGKMHDAYVLADILKEDVGQLLEASGLPRQVDLVCLYGVIEHLPKRLGFDLLEKCEAITSKYLLLETPNGFVEQGPEFGNVYQRHLSGMALR